MMTYEYRLNKNVNCDLEERRSLDVTHAKRIVNITVGNKRRPDSCVDGETTHTISLNKEQLGSLIGILQQINLEMETARQ